jgi:hypothetical protein
MLASFHSDGRIPQDKLLLNSWHRDELILTAQFFSINAGILSGPVALTSSSALSTTHTSSSVNEMSATVVRSVVSLSGATEKKWSSVA